jgi:hypothetical protein
MSTRKSVPALFISTLAAVIAGCGGSGPGDAVEEQRDAFLDGNGEALCALYTDAYLEENFGAESDDPLAACIEDAEGDATALDEEERQQIEDAEINVVEETDTTATVEIVIPGADESATNSLVKEGDEWKVNSEE